MPSRRRLLGATTSALVAPLLVVPLAGPVSSAGAAEGPLGSSVAVDWQRTAVRTVFTEAGSAPPVGELYLAFTSLAVHDAAVEGQRHGSRAAAAAVATAAHDVLRAYFPASASALDADLVTSLAKIPDGAKEDAGVDIGAAAAAAMIASRVGDGRGDASVVYTKTAALGVWPAAPVIGGMVAPWVGFVDPIVDIEPVVLDGPDPITSAAFATDHEEVRRLGSTVATNRTPEQTTVAQFFAGNPLPMYRDALCALLEAEPMGLIPTTRLFARVDTAQAMSLIEAWRLKYELGYWRPFQAIAAAGSDDNPGTQPHPVPWTPLVTNPPYSEYPSGHAQATSAFAEVVRRTLGDDTPLMLRFGGVQRGYATLSDLEFDAFHARIWGGLHFRDAMEDGYDLGHATAGRVMRVVR